MSDSEDNTHYPRRLGGGMVAAAWVLVLLMLTWLFNGYLERQRNPNQNVQVMQTTAGIDEVVLQRNRYGHYVASGSINGMPVEFMLDTGASDVSIPEGVARRLGLEKGAPARYQTANGDVTAYSTRLDEVRLGVLRVRDVPASINPGMEGQEILLGMSFLKQLEFTQRGDSLTLRPMY